MIIAKFVYKVGVDNKVYGKNSSLYWSIAVWWFTSFCNGNLSED